MEYRVEGILRFHPTSKLKLGETLSFSSPSGAQVALNSDSDDNLSAQIYLETDDQDAVKDMAEIELDRISNLLGYFHDVSLERVSMTGMKSPPVDAKGRRMIFAHLTVRMRTKPPVVKELDSKSAEELRHRLENVYPIDFEDVTSMWREAISTESPALKYILLYRLIEFLFSNKGEAKTRLLTDWIKKKEPSVNMYPPDQYRNYHYTHYTYLRDNIHAKTKQFPHTEIVRALPTLQRLTKQAIEEKLGF